MVPFASLVVLAALLTASCSNSSSTGSCASVNKCFAVAHRQSWSGGLLALQSPEVLLTQGWVTRPTEVDPWVVRLELKLRDAPFRFEFLAGRTPSPLSGPCEAVPHLRAVLSTPARHILCYLGNISDSGKPGVIGGATVQYYHDGWSYRVDYNGPRPKLSSWLFAVFDGLRSPD
jgi:hypothetical protein